MKNADYASTDPQGQGRGPAREGPQGGDGRQACEDQGRPREETGARAAEEAGGGRRRRGDRPVDYDLTTTESVVYRLHASLAEEKRGRIERAHEVVPAVALIGQAGNTRGVLLSLGVSDAMGVPSSRQCDECVSDHAYDHAFQAMPPCL